MNFYFKDVDDFEKRIITDILTDIDLKYKVIKNTISVQPEEIDINFSNEDYDEIYIISYDIVVNTTLEQFDYAKWLINKRINLISKLNKSYYKKENKKKVSKKKDDENKKRTTDIRK